LEKRVSFPTIKESGGKKLGGRKERAALSKIKRGELKGPS